MLGIGKVFRKTARPATAATLAGLRPYRSLDDAARRALLARSRQIEARTGQLAEELPADMAVYLLRGCLQLQTRTGCSVLVRSGTPAAQFALPSGSDMLSVIATEPCTLLAVPQQAPGRAATQPPPAPVPLEPAEREALDALRRHLQGRRLELPSLPDLALKISQAIDDPETDNSDIARLVQLDPGLTARLLSVVNSAAFGGVSKITSIQVATSRLGRKKVRSLVYSCLLKSIFKIQSPLLKKRMEALWQHSAQVAALSFVIARTAPGIDPEHALLAGLVHDIGAVAAIAGIARYPALCEREAVLDYVIETLRVDLGLQTLAQWGLLDEIGAVVRDAEDWLRDGSAIVETADVVLLAQMHAYIGRSAGRRLPPIDQVPAHAKLANGALTPGKSLQLLADAADDVREVLALISAD